MTFKGPLVKQAEYRLSLREWGRAQKLPHEAIKIPLFDMYLPIRPIRSQLPEFQAADRESPASPAVVGSLPVTLIRV